jgi:Ankyrin repeats (3 copies)
VMGCGSSAATVSSNTSVVPPPAGTQGTAVAPSRGTAGGAYSGPPIDWQVIQSAVRWNRDPNLVRSMLATGSEVANLGDPKTGNSPLHVAAQNGHHELVKMLLEYKSVVNSQNLKGNTSLHMAVGYDYYECVKLLLDSGADINLTNSADSPAHAGLEGDKSIGFAALVGAKTKADADQAFAMLKETPGKLSKADFVKTGLRLKKEIPDWPQDSFKDVLAKLA